MPLFFHVFSVFSAERLVLSVLCDVCFGNRLCFGLEVMETRASQDPCVTFSGALSGREGGGQGGALPPGVSMRHRAEIGRTLLVGFRGTGTHRAASS